MALAPPGWYPDDRRAEAERGTETDARPLPPPRHPATPHAQPANSRVEYAAYGRQFDDRTDGKAVASLVLGIVSFFLPFYGILTAIVGIALGAVARGQTQPFGPKKGRGLATAGLTCSIIALVLWVLVLVVALAALSTMNWEDGAALIATPTWG